MRAAMAGRNTEAETRAILDEPLKLTGDVGVLNWIDAQIIETLYLSTISLA
jgi:plasmid stability protein